MSEFDFDLWFDGFWSLYDSKYCGGSAQKGAKTAAKAAAKKKVKGEAQGKEIYASLVAQKRYFDDCIKNNQFHARFPMASTWLNQERWSVEIDSHAEMREMAKGEPRSCKCGKPGVISQFEKTKDNDCRSDRYIGSVCLSCHNKAFEKHDWRYHACREKYKEMMDLSKDGGKSLTEQREIAKKFIDRIRSKLNAR